MISRILAALWISALLAFAGGTLTSSTTTYTQEGLAEGLAYQVSAGGTWAGATITVAVFNHTLGDYVNVTTLTSTSATKRIRATGQKLRATISGGSGTESLAFEALRLPPDIVHPTAAELAEIITEDPAAATAATGPAVWVTFADGTRVPYKPTADSNTARGVALETAWTACLATSGAETVELYPANFYIAKSTSTINGIVAQFAIESKMILKLNGARLYKKSTDTASAMFRVNAMTGVNDWAIIGPGTLDGSYAANSDTAARGSAAAEIGISAASSRRFKITSVIVKNMAGVGLELAGSGMVSDEYGATVPKTPAGSVSQCNFDLNNNGAVAYSTSEYHIFTGCTFNKNVTGFDVYQSANLSWSSCHFVKNTTYGMRVRGSGGNNSHCTASACLFNHNDLHAVYLDNAVTYGITFLGCHFFADSATTNKIESVGKGLQIVGGIIDSPFYAAATPTGFNMVTNCYFPLSVVSAAQAVTDLSSAERLQWVFESNVTATGGYANNDDMVYSFADDSAAGTGGMTAGRKYRNSSTNAIAVKQ